MTRSLGQRVQDLRAAFDSSFAAAREIARPDTEDFLSVRIAGDPYALRVRELAGLVSAPRIVPLPSSTPMLLGLVGVRGSLVAAYSLGRLLGYGPNGVEPKWLALVQSSEMVAFAFDELEAFDRAFDAQTSTIDGGASKHTHEAVRIGTIMRHIVDTRSALDAVNVHVGTPDTRKEG